MAKRAKVAFERNLGVDWYKETFHCKTEHTIKKSAVSSIGMHAVNGGVQCKNSMKNHKNCFRNTYLC